MKQRQGFTLIELLVVVLIIGILTAIALPQYTKAVEKAKATEGLTLLKSLGEADEIYYLENGEYAKSFSDLSIQIPWTENTSFLTSNYDDTGSNKDWSVQLEKYPGKSIFMARISGKYQGTGFVYFLDRPETQLKPHNHTIVCMERPAATPFIFSSAFGKGDYCTKLFNGKLIFDDSWTRFYSLP
ncbi:MAG: prepilin-type N-terminal cleavage/methylation domain-containing protein [Elusimicrobiaceae bacterium]|nr:prepilin-type N-terminal cleavage/methylation domain-containing protein [Elusimicrobiaceae bacterium]